MKGVTKLSKECYRPNTKIVQYLKDRVKMSELLIEKMRSRFSPEEKNFDDKLRQDKKRLLDNVIFPSMANLVIFFEYIAENKELRELFEDDVKELLGFKGQSAKYEDNIITRLLQSILKWDSNNDPNNFRLELISSIQNVLFNKIIPLSLMDNKLGDSMTNGIVAPDVGRALLWARNFSSRYVYSSKKNDQTEEPTRPIKF